MALKPTIYKFKIDLSDLDRNYYDSLNLTVAQHPSETAERMMVRLLAFCINAEENLVFTKGLSSVEEPDLWLRTLDDQITLWVDVGEPSVDRIKKASRVAKAVRVYSFNTKSAVWWKQEQQAFSSINAQLYQFQWESIQAFAQLLQRSMTLSVTITDASAYIATETDTCEIAWQLLSKSE